MDASARRLLRPHSLQQSGWDSLAILFVIPKKARVSSARKHTNILDRHHLNAVIPIVSVAIEAARVSLCWLCVPLGIHGTTNDLDGARLAQFQRSLPQNPFIAAGRRKYCPAPVVPS